MRAPWSADLLIGPKKMHESSLVSSSLEIQQRSMVSESLAKEMYESSMELPWSADPLKMHESSMVSESLDRPEENA